LAPIDTREIPEAHESRRRCERQCDWTFRHRHRQVVVGLSDETIIPALCSRAQPWRRSIAYMIEDSRLRYDRGGRVLLMIISPRSRVREWLESQLLRIDQIRHLVNRDCGKRRSAAPRSARH